MQMPSRGRLFLRRGQVSVNRRALLNQRQDLRALLSHRNRVLYVGAGAAVDRDHGPPVFQSFRVVRTEIYHRLDRKNIAFFDFWALARLSVVRNLRILMHLTPDAVADANSELRKAGQGPKN